MPQEIKHIMDVIPKFREIIENLEKIKRFLVKESRIDYQSQDARMVALDSLQLTISAVGMWIQCCNSLANCYTCGKSFDEQQFLKSIGSGVNKDQTEMIMFDHLKLGFITLTHFKIDNLFQNILRHLNVLPREKTGYWTLTDTIFKECSMSPEGAEKDCLIAFANIRNSLHNNGIHRGKDLEVSIDGMEFKFVNNLRVECASWGHIIVLLNANVKILEKILQSDKVKNIKTPIKDDFAFGA
jgi:hypothetical protein